jgi:hypothetical protein
MQAVYSVRKTELCIEKSIRLLPFSQVNLQANRVGAFGGWRFFDIGEDQFGIGG